MCQNLDKAKIYKITNDYNDDIYVGSTCDDLNKRFSVHKCLSHPKYAKQSTLYTLINEIGFERFRIDLIEEVIDCKDKYDLRIREAYWIRQISTLNVRINEGINKRENLHSYNMIPDIREKQINYIKNRRLNPEYLKTEYEKKKEKIECECGCIINRGNISYHLKSKKHTTNLENKKYDLIKDE
jgi:predicted GIY-YIG superfamily endonuclease